MLSQDQLAALVSARQQLVRTCADAPSVADLAAELGCSQGTFIRRFESVFGYTPHQLRVRLRIERAKRLLVESERSVTEICFEVGYESLGTFSAHFSSRVGVSPREYRRRHAGENLVPGCMTLLGGG